VDESLWKFDSLTGSRHKVDSGPYRFTRILWPSAEERAQAAVTSLVIRTGESASDVVRVHLSGTGTLESFPIPPNATNIAAYDQNHNLVVATAPQDPDGTFLWTGSGGTTRFVRRLALNEHLAGIAGGDRRLINYRSSTGQELKAMLFLPPGYEEGRRYPLITWVYPGTMIRDLSSASDWTPKNHAHFDNLHVLAGHGYAVLIPSMPPTDDGGLRGLEHGVMPAIDRVIQTGNRRLGSHWIWIGQSGGGSVTYGLITQTDRFKAAVAINGFADTISAYGTFSGEVRYTDASDDKFAPGGMHRGRILSAPSKTAR